MDRREKVVYYQHIVVNGELKVYNFTIPYSSEQGSKDEIFSNNLKVYYKLYCITNIDFKVWFTEPI